MMPNSRFIIILLALFCLGCLPQKNIAESNKHDTGLQETTITEGDPREIVSYALDAIKNGDTLKAILVLNEYLGKRPGGLSSPAKSISVQQFIKDIDAQMTKIRGLYEKGKRTEAKALLAELLGQFLSKDPEDIHDNSLLAEKFLNLYTIYTDWEDQELFDMAKGADQEKFKELYVSSITTNIPMVVNNTLVSFFERFRKRVETEAFIAQYRRGIPYKKFVEQELKAVGVPEEFFFLAFQESGFSLYARSPHPWDCRGFWQFKDATFIEVISRMRKEKNTDGSPRYPELSKISAPIVRISDKRNSELIDYRYDPVIATKAAAYHLAELYTSWSLYLDAYAKSGGFVLTEERKEQLLPPLVMASYNRGEGNVLSDIDYYRMRYGDKSDRAVDFFSTFTYTDEARYAPLAEKNKSILRSALRQNVQYVYLIYARILFAKNLLLNSPDVLYGPDDQAEKGLSPEALFARKPVAITQGSTFWDLSGKDRSLLERYLFLNPAFVAGIVPSGTTVYAENELTPAALPVVKEVLFRSSLPEGLRQMIYQEIPEDIFVLLNRGRSSDIFFPLYRVSLSQESGGRSQEGCGAYYITKKSDTLWSIAQQHGLSLTALNELNPQQDPILAEGTSLCVATDETSCGQTYVVKKGDSLNSIAKVYGLTLAQLTTANSSLSEFLVPGKTKVCIPGPTPAILSGREKDQEKKVDTRPTPKEEKKPRGEVPRLKKKKLSSGLDLLLAVVWNKAAEEILLDPIRSFDQKLQMLRQKEYYVPERKTFSEARLLVEKDLNVSGLKKQGLKNVEEQKLIAGKELLVAPYYKELRIRMTRSDMDFIEKNGERNFFEKILKEFSLPPDKKGYLEKKYSGKLVNNATIRIPLSGE